MYSPPVMRVGAPPTTDAAQGGDTGERPARRGPRVPSVHERLVSLVLIAVLPLIAAAVYVAGGRPDPELLPPALSSGPASAGPQVANAGSSSSGSAPATTSPSGPAPTATALPLDLAVARFVGSVSEPGWTVDAAPVAFEAARLYEKIDGRADLYLRRGVRRLVSTSLASGDHFIDAFVYDLGTPVGADGLLQEERSSGAREVSIGRGGYVAAGSVFFTVECYYVQLIGSDTAAETERATAAFGRGLAPLLGSVPCR